MAIESEFTSSQTYLQDLPEVEATFRFSNSNHLKTRLCTFLDFAIDRDELSDKIILVTDVPPESLNTDTDESPLYPKSCRALYLEKLRTLVLVMASTPHEEASRQFGARLNMKINDMGCFDEASLTGSAKRSLKNAKKQPDDSWGPASKGYITFTIESGVSETNRKLERDAALWLESTEESRVTQVVTIKIHRSRSEIVFSLWKAEEQGEITRPRAVISEVVHVTLINGQPTADGQLCLSFAEFFEREPRRGTAEKNVSFSKRDLEAISRAVWKDMGFMPR